MAHYITFQDLLGLMKSSSTICVFARTSGIGDAIMTLPAITAVRKKLGEDVIFVMLCSEYLSTVFEHTDCLDFIILYSSEQIVSHLNVRHIEIIRHSGTMVYDFEHPCPCGVHELDTTVPEKRSRQEVFAERCEVEFDINNYNFKLHSNDLDSPYRLGLPERYIAIGIRSSGLWKDYRYMKWLITKLVQFGRKHDFQVVTLDKDIQLGVNGAIELIGHRLTDLYGVLAGSLLTISTDSGYIHVAGALEVPVYGLFGPTPPHLFLRYKNISWLPAFKRCARQYCWYTPCRLKPCLSVNPNGIVKALAGTMKEFGII